MGVDFDTPVHFPSRTRLHRETLGKRGVCTRVPAGKDTPAATNSLIACFRRVNFHHTNSPMPGAQSNIQHPTVNTNRLSG